MAKIESAAGPLCYHQKGINNQGIEPIEEENKENCFRWFSHA